jgi:hypothetical protein
LDEGLLEEETLCVGDLAREERPQHWRTSGEAWEGGEHSVAMLSEVVARRKSENEEREKGEATFRFPPSVCFFILPYNCSRRAKSDRNERLCTAMLSEAQPVYFRVEGRREKGKEERERVSFDEGRKGGKRGEKRLSCPEVHAEQHHKQHCPPNPPMQEAHRRPSQRG